MHERTNGKHVSEGPGGKGGKERGWEVLQMLVLEIFFQEVSIFLQETPFPINLLLRGASVLGYEKAGFLFWFFF